MLGSSKTLDEASNATEDEVGISCRRMQARPFLNVLAINIGCRDAIREEEEIISMTHFLKKVSTCKLAYRIGVPEYLTKSGVGNVRLEYGSVETGLASKPRES